MESQAFQQMINSPGLWITSGVMVIASVLQAFIFFRTSLKEAKELGIERQKYRAGIRSAVITSIGPSFSPVIVLMSMVAVLGGPTTWMRLCDVGAARTELAVVSLAAGLAGTEVGSASFGSTAFSYSLWAMALNNLGWLVIVLLLTHRMSGIVVKMNTKFDPKWVKLLMGGATLGTAGSYIGWLAGSVGDIRLPAASMAQKVVGVEPGTHEGDVIGTIGTACSVFVSAGMITLFIAIGSYVVPNLPQFVTDSFNNILPALFGAIYVDIARKDIRAGVCGFIAGAAILFLGGKLGINNGILTVLIVLSGILINRVFFVMDKKKAAQNA